MLLLLLQDAAEACACFASSAAARTRMKQPSHADGRAPARVTCDGENAQPTAAAPATSNAKSGSPGDISLHVAGLTHTTSRPRAPVCRLTTQGAGQFTPVAATSAACAVTSSPSAAAVAIKHAGHSSATP